MSFYSTYDLIQLLRDDGIKTFEARVIATGQPVLVHLFPTPQSAEMQSILAAIARLAPSSRKQIIAQGDHEGTPYVVTGRITAYPGFREWLLQQPLAAPAPTAAAPPSVSPSAASGDPDDPFASLFKKPPVASAPAPKSARPLTEEFQHLIETPTRNNPAMQNSPRGAKAAGSEGSTMMSTQEVARALNDQPPPASALAPPDAHARQTGGRIHEHVPGPRSAGAASFRSRRVHEHVSDAGVRRRAPAAAGAR